jgi:hypothetical protein
MFVGGTTRWHSCSNWPIAVHQLSPSMAICAGFRGERFQVIVPLASNVTLAPYVELTCPLGSNFQDAYGGLYGEKSYTVASSWCASADPENSSVLASSLEFTCVECGRDEYTVTASSSNGLPGQHVPATCQPCPGGGECEHGQVKAAPGYWGAPNKNGNVTFAVCPGGYCCNGVCFPVSQWGRVLASGTTFSAASACPDTWPRWAPHSVSQLNNADPRRPWCGQPWFW